MQFVHKYAWMALVLSVMVATLAFGSAMVYAAPADENDSEQTVDAKKSAMFAKATTAVRVAMMKRDLKGAKRNLKAASTYADTKEDKAQVERLNTLLGYLEQFWDGVRDVMASLQPLQEIPINDTRIIIVTSSREKITIKGEGRVVEFTVEKMPSVLVRTFADMTFKKDTDSRVVIAAFHAVDPRGDRKLAESYWREAAQAGIDTDKLLPELNTPPFNSQPTSTSPGRSATHNKANTRAKW